MQDLREMTLSQASLYFQREFGLCETEEETVLAVRDLMRQEYEQSIPLKSGVKNFLTKLQQQECKNSALLQQRIGSWPRLLYAGWAYGTIFLKC